MAASQDSSLPEFVIEPNRSLFRIDWRELIEHRDLLFLLVRRDLVAKYKQTILGPLWHVIQPLIMAFVFTLVFSRVTSISTEGVPRILFYLCGLLGWNYFTSSLTSTSATFRANATLFGKVYFPRLVVPLANALSNLVSMSIQFGVFLLFYAFYKLLPAGQSFHTDWKVVLLPLLVIHTAAMSLGFGLCLSAFTVKYRDLQHAIPFLMTIWMFATPVIYPVSQIPPSSRWLFLMNPMAVVIESYRAILLGIGSVQPRSLVISIAVMMVVFTLGLILFHRAQRTATDTV